MTDKQKQTFDKVILWVTGMVGIFIILSLLAQFILVYTDRIEPDEGVWRPIYDLVLVLVSSVGGYVTGQTIERRKRNGE
jgi:hypothetical protein